MSEQNVFLRLEYHRLLHTLQRFHHGNVSPQYFPTQPSAESALPSHHATDLPPPSMGQPPPPFSSTKGESTPAASDTRISPPATQHVPCTTAQAPTESTESGESTCPYCHLNREDVTLLKQKAKELGKCTQFHQPKMVKRTIGSQTSGSCPQAPYKKVPLLPTPRRGEITPKTSFNTASASTPAPTPDLRISLANGKSGRSVFVRGPVTKIRNRVPYSRLSSDDESNLDFGE